VVGVAAGEVGQGAAGIEEPDVGAVADGEVAEGLGDVAFPHADRAVEDDDSRACCPPPRSATSRPCGWACTPASPSSSTAPVGVGKSHIAQSLGHLAIRHGADVRFLNTSRALAHLAGGHADHTWHKTARRTRPARRTDPR